MTGPEQHSVKVDTEYVVLGRTVENEWAVLKTVTSRTAEAAVKTEAASSMDAFDQYVAVPSRSWKPVKVSRKVETTLVVTEASDGA